MVEEEKKSWNINRLVMRFEETGSTLMLIGLTCLFIYLMINTPLGFGVPMLSLVCGAGMWAVSRIVKKMAPGM